MQITKKEDKKENPMGLYCNRSISPPSTGQSYLYLEETTTSIYRIDHCVRETCECKLRLWYTCNNTIYMDTRAHLPIRRQIY